MQNSRTTAGETARTLVVFRDCHASTRIAVRCTGTYDERFVRGFAKRMGWPCTIRKPKAHTEVQTRPEVRLWRKPSCIEARPRPKLSGAFNLTLTASAMEGGER